MSDELAPLVGDYTLTRVNHKAPQTPAPVTLRLRALPDDKDKLCIHAKVANAMGGSVALEDGNLKGFLMSTQRMGAPAQMTVERILSRGLMEGMAYTLEDKVLTMFGKAGSLEWTLDSK